MTHSNLSLIAGIERSIVRASIVCYVLGPSMQAVIPKIRGVCYNHDASFIYAALAILTIAQQDSESERGNVNPEQASLPVH